MKIISSTLLVILSTLLISFAGFSALLSAPDSGDSRDVLIIAIGITGVIIGFMATRELAKINKILNA